MPALWQKQTWPIWLTELFCLSILQNPHKFFPEEHFGDESPLLTLRQSGGRCRVNSTPTAETLFTELDSFVAFHPPLPPPPPPYHPPATPIHNQFKVGWKQKAQGQQHPSRSFSYPCNHSLFHSRTAPKVAPPIYLSGVKATPPDCTNTTGIGRQTVAAAAAVMAAEKQVVSIPNLFMTFPHTHTTHSICEWQDVLGHYPGAVSKMPTRTVWHLRYQIRCHQPNYRSRILHMWDLALGCYIEVMY